jgi:hypothetical protein
MNLAQELFQLCETTIKVSNLGKLETEDDKSSRDMTVSYNGKNYKGTVFYSDRDGFSWEFNPKLPPELTDSDDWNDMIIDKTS